MTLAVALLLFVLAVLTIGSKLLVRITAQGRAPRLAIVAWLTAVATVLGCSLAAVALLLVEAAGHRDSILVGHAGVSVQIVAAAAVAIATGGLVIVGVRIARALARMRAHTFAHADAVRLVGRSDGGDVVVIAASEPAAYCVAGRPPAIVVTTAALTALDHAQLAAVVAHERAHLTGRHAYIVAAVRGLSAALPRIRLLATAATHIGSLLEMCADDAAARRHGREPLLGGLMALAGAVTPAHSLAASGVAVLARAERLSDPPRALTRIRNRIALVGTATTMAATPALIAALSLSGALMCFL